MRNWYTPWIVALALLVAACSTSSDPRLARIEKITSFCSGFTQSLNTLSTMRDMDRLSEGQVAAVNTSVSVMQPVCLGGAESMSGDRLDLAMEAILVINDIMESR